MSGIVVDVWLHVELTQYGGEAKHGSYANSRVELPENSTLRDLLARLKICTEKRGITFINGSLTAKPNIQMDLDHPLKDNDRVAFFDLHGRWTFQSMI